MTENLSHLHDVVDNAVIEDRENGVIRAKREIFTDEEVFEPSGMCPGTGARLALPTMRSAGMRRASMMNQVWSSVTALTSGAAPQSAGSEGLRTSCRDEGSGRTCDVRYSQD
jgi:hypothetical protein